MKISAKGVRVTVEYPDGRTITYDGDKGDQIMLSVNKAGEDRVDNVAYCNGQHMANSIQQHMAQNITVARHIVREFIAQDIPRMLRERGVTAEAEDDNELTLDRLMAKGEPGSGRTH